MGKVNYSKLIESYCQKNKLSVPDFATQLGINVRTVFRWLSGENYPSYNWRNKLNQLLEVSEIRSDNADSEVFVISPIAERRRMSVTIDGEFYDMLREMALVSDSKITHACEQCIKFAYERFGG